MALKNLKTIENIERRRKLVNEVQIIDNKPLFSSLDINITELCNRKCVFCPRVNENEYPNQNLNIDLGLINKISEELINLNYQGEIVISGFGEPTLNKDLTV